MPGFVYFDGQVDLVWTASPAPPNAGLPPPSDGAPYTWTGEAIGVAAPDRRIVVVTPHISATNISSVSVAGVACTKVVAGSGTFTFADIWVTSTPITSGTTANITVSGYATFPRIACVLYALYGAGNPLSPTAYSDTSATYDAAITVPAGGAALGVFASQVTGSASWTNMSSDISANFNAGGGAQYTYSSARSTTAGSYTVTATPSAAAASALGVAVWST